MGENKKHLEAIFSQPHFAAPQMSGGDEVVVRTRKWTQPTSFSAEPGSILLLHGGERGVEVAGSNPSGLCGFNICREDAALSLCNHLHHHHHPPFSPELRSLCIKKCIYEQISNKHKLIIMKKIPMQDKYYICGFKDGTLFA